MTVAAVVARRQITEVMHFTTQPGLIGVLASQSLKSRKRLRTDQYVEHVYTPNCPTRRDVAYLDYVNLSLNWINPALFQIASERWHQDKAFWWCILAFDPSILSHPGVLFATTNNMWSGVERGAGAKGLEALFVPEVVQWRSGGRVQKKVVREANRASFLPTCAQAEALYPGEVSTEHMRRIYVATEDHRNQAHAIRDTLNHPDVAIVVRPELFQDPEPSTSP